MAEMKGLNLRPYPETLHLSRKKQTSIASISVSQVHNDLFRYTCTEPELQPNVCSNQSRLQEQRHTQHHTTWFHGNGYPLLL